MKILLTHKDGAPSETKTVTYPELLKMISPYKGSRDFWHGNTAYEMEDGTKLTYLGA